MRFKKFPTKICSLVLTAIMAISVFTPIASAAEIEDTTVGATSPSTTESSTAPSTTEEETTSTSNVDIQNTSNSNVYKVKEKTSTGASSNAKSSSAYMTNVNKAVNEDSKILVSTGASSKNYSLIMYNGNYDNNKIVFTKTIKGLRNQIDKTPTSISGTVEIYLVGPEKGWSALGKYCTNYNAAVNDGYKPIFCVYPHANVTNNGNQGYKQNYFNIYYNKMSKEMKDALGYLSSAGVPGRYMGKTACYATQLMYWEFITGLRSTSTLQLKKSSNNLSKYIKNAKNGSVTVSNIQKMYNSIDSKLKSYGEKAKGYKYSYDTKPEGYAKKTVDFATSMKDAKGKSTLNGNQISKKATYQYEYKMKLLYPSRYTDYKIVNGSGQKASGTNGKFTLSVSKGGYITIKSKKSIQEYKEAFYLTFKQNVSGSYKTFAGTNSAFGVNVSKSFKDQNLMEAGKVNPKLYYYRLNSVPRQETFGQLTVLKETYDSEGDEITDESQLKGWSFQITYYNKDNVKTSVLRTTNEDGELANLIEGIKKNTKATVKEIGRAIGSNDESKYTNITTINGKKYGFPEKWDASKTQVAVNSSSYSTGLSKTVTITGTSTVSFKFKNIKVVKKQVRVLKTSDDDKVDGFYFRIYDKDYKDGTSKVCHLNEQIVGPTDDSGYTPYVDTNDNKAFKMGIHELGVYVSGDKKDEKSYQIPSQYDPQEEDTIVDVTKEMSKAEGEVHNVCSGYIKIVKTDNLTGSFVPNATYGIFYNETYQTVNKDNVSGEDTSGDDEQVKTDTNDSDFTYNDKSDAEDTDDSKGDDTPETETTQSTTSSYEDSDDDDTSDVTVDDKEEVDDSKVTDIINKDEDLSTDDPDGEITQVTNKRLVQGINLVGTITTDDKGEAISDSLPIGTYYLQEITAPEHYVLSDEVYKVEVKPGENTVEHPNVVEQKVEDSPVVVKVNKYNAEIHEQGKENEENLAGAVMQLLDAENGNKVIYEWTTTTKTENIYGKCSQGHKYIIHEKSSPTGFKTADDKEFIIPSTISGIIVDILDAPTKVEVSKTDITGQKELPGAKLTVTDKDGKVVETWTSTDKTHLLKGLTVGETYTLREDLAPLGYAKASDIKFTIENTGDVQKVQMKDEETVVNVSKLTKDGKYLSGATLEILDSKGNVVVKPWKTDGNVKTFKGILNAGESYTLKELSAPKGYLKAEDVKFTMPEEAKALDVKMTDEVEPHTPTPPVKTGVGSYAILLLSIAGAGVLSILLISKKRKSK